MIPLLVALTAACAPIQVDYRADASRDAVPTWIDTDAPDTLGDTLVVDSAPDSAPSTDTGAFSVLEPDPASGDTDGLPVLFHALHRMPGDVTAVVAYTACGMVPDSATAGDRLVTLAFDEATGRAWGRTADGDFVARDPATLAPRMQPAVPASAGGFTWDPVRERVVGWDATGKGTFLLIAPETGDVLPVGSLDGVDPTAITYVPSTGGFVVLAGSELLVYGADLGLVSRRAAHGVPADGHLALAASVDEVWAVFHPRPPTLVSFERRQYRVDVATGAFTEEPCAHWVSPQPQYPRHHGLVASTPPPPGVTALVVGDTLSAADACAPLSTMRELPDGHPPQATLDWTTTGDVFTADRELVRTPLVGPSEVVPQDPALPPLVHTGGLAWADGRVWLLAGAGDGYLFDHADADGWHVHGTLQGLGLGPATYDPRAHRLLALGAPGLLWVLTLDGGPLHALAVPRALAGGDTQLRLLGDRLVAWTGDGRRFEVDPATGETARIACP